MILLAVLVLQQQPLAAQTPTPYWQQRVVYQINARLDEPTYTLAGDESVKYINHSPDTLRTISFHLYLNAFRPGSRWSDADSAERRRRFNDLKDPDFGFNHVRNVKVDGTAVEPFWPFGRDSTIVRFTLPRALAPGDSMTVTMDWDARPSIPPRRQGRRGRSYDFAQWYPKVVVYDKYGWEEHALYPAGEFYGEFGDFFVKLDVPKDQVVGATGVPVCGDPGWSGANQQPREPSVRTAWHASAAGGPRSSTSRSTRAAIVVDAAGCVASSHATRRVRCRKEILWVARDVHNFAMSMSPDYRYEGGEVNGTLVHVLYQPGDEKTWGGGIVVNNTITMLKWMDFIFGPYPWPQMTVVHRIEGGGTEFPMMEMNGSPSLGLNLHEGGHTYLMGILANNEWKEGWMDEGFTSFQTSWYEEIQAKQRRRHPQPRSEHPAERSRRRVAAGVDVEREVPRLQHLQQHDLQSRRALPPRAEADGRRLDDARDPAHATTPAGSCATSTKRRSRRSPRRSRIATCRPSSRSGCTTWSSPTTRSRARSASADRRGWRTTVDVARKAPGIYPVTVAVYGRARHGVRHGQTASASASR